MSGATILIVEDEPSISEVVCLYLTRAGYQVLSAADGLEALNILDRHMPDLVILDLMLPKIDGLKITRLLREHNDLPIIMLTARREEADRITGLELGADDYVVKPFSPQELVSRVRAVLRRSQGSPPESHARSLTFSELTIDPKTRLVTAQGREIVLTVKEFDMLWLLACHPRQVFTRDELLEQVWGLSDYIDPGTVTVHIRRLREKIETNPSNPAHLLTVWGLGYKFEP